MEPWLFWPLLAVAYVFLVFMGLWGCKVLKQMRDDQNPTDTTYFDYEYATHCPCGHGWGACFQIDDCPLIRRENGRQLFYDCLCHAPQEELEIAVR